MPRSLIPLRLTDKKVKQGKRKGTQIPVKEVDWLENLLREVLV